MLRFAFVARAQALLIALGLLVWTGTTFGHERFEVDATVGARFGGRASVFTQDATGNEAQSGTLVLSPAVAYGGIFGYRMKPNGFAFVSFSRSQTSTRLEVDGAGDLDTGTLAIEYYQIGGNLEITRGIFVPYFGASAGFGRFAAVGEGTDRVFFSAVVDGGFKLDLHRNVHLRLLGRFPITLANNDLRCEDEGGCVLLDKFSPFVQVETQFGLGVSF